MIAMIVGMTKERVIGKHNSLPWHIREDLKNFKELTTGNVVIMGRKTYESLPQKFRPLPNRHNIVLSRSMASQEGIELCDSVENALRIAKLHHKNIFIIGGSTIYNQFLPFTDTMFISYIKKNYEGDTYFPAFDETIWDITETREFEEFTFVKYEKK
jgi:dihydrofolate reductase